MVGNRFKRVPFAMKAGRGAQPGKAIEGGRQDGRWRGAQTQTLRAERLLPGLSLSSATGHIRRVGGGNQ